jgi:hypothetical protein
MAGFGARTPEQSDIFNPRLRLRKKLIRWARIGLALLIPVLCVLGACYAFTI